MFDPLSIFNKKKSKLIKKIINIFKPGELEKRWLRCSDKGIKKEENNCKINSFISKY